MILLVRIKLGIFDTPPTAAILKKEIADWFLGHTNKEVEKLSLRHFGPVLSLHKANYVFEHKYLSVLAQFRLGVAGLGNRVPRVGHVRKLCCPLCPTHFINSELHLVCECPAVSSLRAASGVTSFLNHCISMSVSMDGAYDRFVCGLDWSGGSVPLGSYLDRGKAMDDLRKLWLSKK